MGLRAAPGAQLQCTRADPSHRPKYVYWARSTRARLLSHGGARDVSVSPSFYTRIGPCPGVFACPHTSAGFRPSGAPPLRFREAARHPQPAGEIPGGAGRGAAAVGTPAGENPGGAGRGAAAVGGKKKKMSYLLPHLHSGWAVDQAILAEEERLVIIRFGHDWDETCMQVSSNILTLEF